VDADEGGHAAQVPPHIQPAGEVEARLEVGQCLVPASLQEPQPRHALIAPGEIVRADAMLGQFQGLLEGLLRLGVPVELGQADATVDLRGELGAGSGAEGFGGGDCRVGEGQGFLDPAVPASGAGGRGHAVRERLDVAAGLGGGHAVPPGGGGIGGLDEGDVALGVQAVEAGLLGEREAAGAKRDGDLLDGPFHRALAGAGVGQGPAQCRLDPRIGGRDQRGAGGLLGILGPAGAQQRHSEGGAQPRHLLAAGRGRRIQDLAEQVGGERGRVGGEVVGDAAQPRQQRHGGWPGGEQVLGDPLRGGPGGQCLRGLQVQGLTGR
jgi:hypothetical protein